MNRYQHPTPRAASGLAAVAMAALTIGLSVVVPARFDSAAADPRALSMRNAGQSTRTEVAIVPARIDVVGERARSTALEQAPPVPARHEKAG